MRGLHLKLLILILLSMLLIGCSTPSKYALSSAPRSQPEADCESRLQQMEQRIAAAEVADPLAYPIETYPYLRVSRLLASFRQQLTDKAQFEAWYQQLLQLGQQARTTELDNLDPLFSSKARADIERCIAIQAARDRQTEGFEQRLIENAQPPELYRDWQRVLGLFPLTRRIVLHQIEQQQRRWQQDFNRAAGLSGEYRQYVPPLSEPLDSRVVASWLQQAAGDHPLGLPLLSADRLRQLFEHHAPQWQVFNQSSADLIGSLYWHQGQPRVNSSDPVSYLLPSYSRFDGELLLQLNYLVWFAERPPQQLLDIYAGRLDGLLWRVTLAMDGTVLLYDSIHPCGCYHQIFPVSARLRLKPPVAGEEQPLILSGVAPPRQAGRLLLQLTPQDHYLQGIGLLDPDRAGDAPQRTVYRFAGYQQLRSLPAGSARRNLFDGDGLVAQSARLERFVLWPMGVPSPGAMRVWGAHAISFANRRYFDEPYLFERFFERLLSSSKRP